MTSWACRRNMLEIYGKKETNERGYSVKAVDKWLMEIKS